MWCRLAVFVALVGACTSTPSNPAAAAPIAYSAQDKFLARAFAGNFACRVNSLKVSVASQGKMSATEMKEFKDSVLASLANVATLEWAHVAQTSFSAMDDRNDEKVLGTPGGDMGEFIQALQAYTKVTSQQLSDDDIAAVFERYLTVMSRPKFFYETDEKSYISLATATGCRNLHIAEMGGMRHKRAEVLKRLSAPEYIGDPFIKFLATNATELGLAPENLHGALAAYHKVLWTSPSKLAAKLCYLEMKGAHNHGAMLNILTPNFCNDQGLAPMISQQLSCTVPVFLHHSEAVKILRRELVTVITAGKKDVDPRDVLEEMDKITDENLAKFWAAKGTDLPVLNVEFLNTSPLLLEEVSFVDDQ